MIVATLKGLAFLIHLMPRPLSRAMGSGLGALYSLCLFRRNAEILERLAMAFPDKSTRELKRIRSRMCRHMGHAVVDLLRMAKISDENMRANCTFIDEHHLRDAYDRSKGVVVVTAHLGGWETIGAVGPLYGYGESIVVKTMRPPSFDQHLTSIRERFGANVLPREGSIRACLRALKKDGHILGFILDQNMKRQDGIFVDFFGKPACTSPGAAFLAQQAGAPIVPIVAVRQPDGRHHIHCLPEIPPPASRDEADIHQATQAATTALETMIRKHPEQWIWMHRRWRTKPPESLTPPPSPTPLAET